MEYSLSHKLKPHNADDFYFIGLLAFFYRRVYVGKYCVNTDFRLSCEHNF